MGDLVREMYPNRCVEDADLNLGQFASAERDRHGYNIWAKRALERMSGDLYLIDGCRSMDEVEAYRGLTDDVNIVAIHTSPSVRYDRLVRRGRDDAPRNLEEFDARDTREIGWGLAMTIVLADNLIVNEGTLDEFRVSVNALLDRMQQ
jgi:dephospho-CoA kinase